MAGYRLLIIIVTLFTFSYISASEKHEKNDKTETIYIFGIGSAFGDTIVSITPIIELKGIKLEKKTGFLPFRSVFSLQLKTYLEGTLGYTQQTCSVVFSDKKKKLQQKYAKVKKAYLEDSGNTINIIDGEKFTFKVPEIQIN